MFYFNFKNEILDLSRSIDRVEYDSKNIRKQKGDIPKSVKRNHVK